MWEVPDRARGEGVRTYPEALRARRTFVERMVANENSPGLSDPKELLLGEHYANAVKPEHPNAVGT